jgi:peptidoglycan/LPS O-acetylase OafA/YrhL
MQDYLGSDLLVVFWSLGVEEKFYLFAPLVLAGVLAVRRPAFQYVIVFAIALLPMLFRTVVARDTPAGIGYPMYFQLFRSPFHLGFDGLAMGMLCALVYRDRARWPALLYGRVSGAAFWGGASVVGSLLVAAPIFDTIGFFDEVALGAVLAVGMSGMLLGLALGGGPRAWFGGRWLFVVSKLSYTLYLVHYALIPAATALSAVLLRWSEPSALARFALFLPIYLGLSFVAAAALHYLVEKPFLALRDHGIRLRLPAARSVPAPLGPAAR